MATRHEEAVWLTEECQFSMNEIVELSGLSEAEVRELVDYGAITPVDPGSVQWIFHGECLSTVRAASRLRVGFDLEPHGVALVVSLLERIRDLESQLDRARAQTPRGAR